MRSETVKEILAGLCDIIRISSRNTPTAQNHDIAESWLPKVIVYDDCCHVIKHIIDYYPNFFRSTPASSFLYNCSFSIDAYHYRNHTDKWCKEYLNPNNNEIVKQFNTQSAEQSNSWIKRFSKQFSRFDDEHCSLFLSLLLHFRNCKERNLNPFQSNIRTSFSSSQIRMF
jgi:IS1 family transposase